MLNGKKKFKILAAFATLLLFAVGVACNGFFVDPVLTSVTVGPTATINQGGTVQESAVGSYNDGSTQALTNVSWSSDTEGVATISTSGLVTGVSPGSATITGASGTVSGTATITVALQNVTGITVTPTSTTIRAGGGTAAFTAKATVAGGAPVDVTATATWSATDANGGDDVTLTQGVSPETVTTTTATAGETITLTAAYLSGSGVTYTANATITVVTQ
ncbi:MAG: Ig-like domain-containing protein [Terriglobales bacterium]